MIYCLPAASDLHFKVKQGCFKIAEQKDTVFSWTSFLWEYLSLASKNFN